MRSKWSKRPTTAIKAAVAVAAVAALAALVPGAAYAWPWSWDMFNQRSYKAQEDTPPPTPEGIVTTNGRVYIKDRADSARLKNPFEATKPSIERGGVKYKTACAPCHGDTGKGDGLVGQKYVAPTDLTTDYVQNKPAGDIYYTITYGGLAIMPSYGDSLSPEDRWHVVNYIKNVLGKKEVKEAAAGK